MLTTPSALQIPERFAIGMDIPLRGLSSNGVAATRKGKAARTRAGEKYISTSGGLAETLTPKRLRRVMMKAAEYFHFIRTMASRGYMNNSSSL
jgi:hypothetical protein